MPTYVYECSSCSKVFEVEQRITADPLKDCNCGAKSSLKRLIQPVAVAFRGSGFHINDYSGKAPASEASPAAETPATITDCTGDKSTCACSATPAAAETKPA